MKVKKRQYNDKIFDNHYNKGDIEFNVINETVEIDKNYVSSNLSEEYNSYEYYRKIKLNENINDIFIKSKWYETYNFIKKVPKDELSELYSYIYINLNDKTYTDIEIFIEIAEYLDIKYNILYDMISNLQKKSLLKELNIDYNVMNKVKLHKLF